MSKNFKTINIHGKEYVSVDERIKFFRNEKAYKGWSMTSEFVELTDESCTMKATITDANGVVRATGSAKEVKGSTFINKTSYVENCETSAWGRALGNMGIGIEASGIASAEEIVNAKNNQNKKPKKTALDNNKFQQMIVAIAEGKADKVKERLANYTTTKKQKDKLNELLGEAIKDNDLIADTFEGLGKVMKEYNQ
tara:strand:- start:988 stop:1575 length:588 start_codon:yes stop_codon:yes gene_type:complete